jgi:uncharacterized membrane protein
MEQLTQGWKKLRTRLIVIIGALVLPSSALGGGLTRAKDALETIESELLTIIPVVAVIALILLAIGYATKSVDKEVFYRWAIGVIIVGSAVEITAMLIT